MATAATPKDVYTINELDGLNRILIDINDFLVEREVERGDTESLRVTQAYLEIRDAQGVLVGSLTKWAEDEDIKFEPNFKLDF